ncbi:MAG: glycosyltransferase family 2 protein [Elusimicrobia bacterium]|nr:glycosyltransferase family 2 protein [Elusimicrobiota bacterium]
MFDEESNAERCVRRVTEALEATDPRGTLIVVDDGSRDRTREILRRLAAEFPRLVVVEHPANAGYGAALVTGIREASRRGLGYALFLDADLTTDPSYVAPFVEKMRGDYDLIKATRYSLGGGMRGVPFHRVAISRVGNAVARALFRLPVADCTNGFRAAKVDLLARIPYREKAFAIIMEEMYYMSSYAKTFAEVSYVLTSRGPDQGVSRFVYKPKVFGQYLKYAVLSLVRPPSPEAPSTEKR